MLRKKIADGETLWTGTTYPDTPILNYGAAPPLRSRKGEHMACGVIPPASQSPAVWALQVPLNETLRRSTYYTPYGEVTLTERPDTFEAAAGKIKKSIELTLAHLKFAVSKASTLDLPVIDECEPVSRSGEQIKPYTNWHTFAKGCGKLPKPSKELMAEWDAKIYTAFKEDHVADSERAAQLWDAAMEEAVDTENNTRIRFLQKNKYLFHANAPHCARELDGHRFMSPVSEDGSEGEVVENFEPAAVEHYAIQPRQTNTEKMEADYEGGGVEDYEDAGFGTQSIANFGVRQTTQDDIDTDKTQYAAKYDPHGTATRYEVMRHRDFPMDAIRYDLAVTNTRITETTWADHPNIYSNLRDLRKRGQRDHFVTRALDSAKPGMDELVFAGEPFYVITLANKPTVRLLENFVADWVRSRRDAIRKGRDTEQITDAYLCAITGNTAEVVVGPVDCVPCFPL